MPDDPTLGEAHRRIDRVENRLDNRVVSLGSYNAERQHDRDEVADLKRRVDKVSDRIDWAFRAAITGVVMPIVVGVALFILLRAQ